MFTGVQPRRGLERSVAIARPAMLLLVLMRMSLLAPRPIVFWVMGFAVLYLALSVGAVLGPPKRWVMAAFGLDLVFLTMLLLATKSVEAFMFFFIFVMFEAGMRWGWGGVVRLSLGLGLLVFLELGVRGPAGMNRYIRATSQGLGVIIVGMGMGFLGEAEMHIGQSEEFIERVVAEMHFERGLGECLDVVMRDVAELFQCENAWIAVRDEDLGGIFVWKTQKGEKPSVVPFVAPLEDAAAYLLDRMDYDAIWNDMEEGGDSFGWGVAAGEILKNVKLVEISKRRLKVKSIAGIVFHPAGGPSGRLLLGNSRKRIRLEDLRLMEYVVARLEQPLANLFHLRHMRAHVIETERGRISRDLHDGLLQTLLSLKIQLGVLAERLQQEGQWRESGELRALEGTVTSETEELRRLVMDMRPTRMSGADLPEMMEGFAERFRRETGIAVDLFLDKEELRLSAHLCRELFQIYREALNNIKKHAEASHVVVKLGQDDSKAWLAVDDNGCGFSFAGKLSNEDLDGLRLGPISIKERTRVTGGSLTIESNPGHGARLTIEIPYS